MSTKLQFSLTQNRLVRHNSQQQLLPDFLAVEYECTLFDLLALPFCFIQFATRPSCLGRLVRVQVKDPTKSSEQQLLHQEVIYSASFSNNDQYSPKILLIISSGHFDARGICSAAFCQRSVAFRCSQQRQQFLRLTFFAYHWAHSEQYILLHQISIMFCSS